MPCSTRHANLSELEYYTRGLPLAIVARHFHTTPATAGAWLSGRRPAPWWTVLIARLNHLESTELARQMGYAKALPRLGVVRAQVIELHRPRPVAAPVPVPLRPVSAAPPPEPGQARA